MAAVDEGAFEPPAALESQLAKLAALGDSAGLRAAMAAHPEAAPASPSRKPGSALRA
jgi:hypothetical protein